MSASEITRSMLKPGLEVVISPKSPRGRGEIANGIIEEILTNSENHPHGVMAKLTTGVIGRVNGLVE